MTFSIKYKPLFQVNILHQFFLNNGTENYFTLSEAEKEKKLISYNISNLFIILPSTKSHQQLAGQNMIFKLSNFGFTIMVKVSESNESVPFIPISEDLEFTFLLKLLNNTFFNFSDLQFENADKLFFFSNKRAGTEPGTFPLIKKAGSTATINDNYVLSAAGAEQELEQLTRAESCNLFGLVKIHMKGETAGLNVTNSQNRIRNSIPVFQVVFENRKTFWRYIFDEEQQVQSGDDVIQDGDNTNVLITTEKHPLTSSGFISIEHGDAELPNPDSRVVKPSNTNNRIYSEIYM